ncbi:hypothetical protein ACFL9T_16645 [Thermodesulfobacteriota bacterium]
MSENSAFVGLGSDEWLGSGAVPRRNVEICGSVEETPLLLQRSLGLNTSSFERVECDCFQINDE